MRAVQKDPFAGHYAQCNHYHPPALIPPVDSRYWPDLKREATFAFYVWNQWQKPARGRCHLVHPAWRGLVEQARAIYNGDVAEDSDADGNLIPLPRVWRFEFHFLRFWVIELPPGFPLDYVLTQLGDLE